MSQQGRERIDSSREGKVAKHLRTVTTLPLRVNAPFGNCHVDVCIDRGDFYIIVEIDHRQHRSGYRLDQEAKRQLAIANVSDKPVAFVRFNPDGNVKTSGRIDCPSETERLSYLAQVVIALSNGPRDSAPKCSAIYLFYDSIGGHSGLEGRRRRVLVRHIRKAFANTKGFKSRNGFVADEPWVRPWADSKSQTHIVNKVLASLSTEYPSMSDRLEIVKESAGAFGGYKKP